METQKELSSSLMPGVRYFGFSPLCSAPGRMKRSMSVLRPLLPWDHKL